MLNTCCERHGIKKRILPDLFTGPTDQIFSRARTLIIHLFKIHNLPATGLLPQIADIAFVPASKGSTMYHKLHPPYGPSSLEHGAPAKQAQTYICFKQGIPEYNEVEHIIAICYIEIVSFNSCPKLNISCEQDRSYCIEPHVLDPCGGQGYQSSVREASLSNNYKIMLEANANKIKKS